MNEFRRRTARELAELYVDDDGSNEVRLVVALGTFLNGERAFKTTMSGGQAAYGDECIHQQEIHTERERVCSCWVRLMVIAMSVKPITAPPPPKMMIINHHQESIVSAIQQSAAWRTHTNTGLGKRSREEKLVSVSLCRLFGRVAHQSSS